MDTYIEEVVSPVKDRLDGSLHGPDLDCALDSLDSDSSGADSSLDSDSSSSSVLN